VELFCGKLKFFAVLCEKLCVSLRLITLYQHFTAESRKENAENRKGFTKMFQEPKI